jgi:hypothetical protein
LDEKKTIVRKMRRASPETRRMYQSRMKKETVTNEQLDAAYKRLDNMERSYQERRDRGEYVHEPTYQRLLRDYTKAIEDLTKKSLARKRFNKRSKK